jgi:hypothetical protein
MSQLITLLLANAPSLSQMIESAHYSLKGCTHGKCFKFDQNKIFHGSRGRFPLHYSSFLRVLRYSFALEGSIGRQWHVLSPKSWAFGNIPFAQCKMSTSIFGFVFGVVHSSQTHIDHKSND